MLIEINLLPENIRPKKDKTLTVSSKQVLSYLFIGAVILVAINLIILSLSFSLRVNIFGLNKKLSKIQPQLQKMQEAERQLQQSQEKMRLAQNLVLNRILWSQKLNIIADTLAQGAWLRYIGVKQNSFNMDGSCVSLKGEEINIIKNLIDTLKEDANFFRDFDNLELKSVQRRLIGGIEVVDFNFVGNIKKQ
jgi:Tfp pilus assembly protein PilN